MKITENLKKTIIGVVAAVLGVAVTLGLFTPDQAATINDGIAGLLENIGGVILGIVAIWGVFTGGKDE